MTDQTALKALQEISPEVARGVKRMAKLRTPHDIAHHIARYWPNMGAAFYRLVEAAAKELAPTPPAKLGLVRRAPMPALQKICNSVEMTPSEAVERIASARAHGHKPDWVCRADENPGAHLRCSVCGALILTNNHHYCFPIDGGHACPGYADFPF